MALRGQDEERLAPPERVLVVLTTNDDGKVMEVRLRAAKKKDDK